MTIRPPSHPSHPLYTQGGRVLWPHITDTPTTLAGYGITGPIVLTDPSQVIMKDDDTGRLAIGGGSAFALANGAFIQLFGTSADAGFRGTVLIQGGNPSAPTGNEGTIILQTQGTDRWRIDRSGHFVPMADNTYDIGVITTGRARSLYLTTELNINQLKVVSSRGSAVANALAGNLSSVITQFNLLLTRLRATGGHGLIAD